MCSNVSPRQVTHELPRLVEAALAASGLAPRRLCLEITESLLVDDPAAIDVLEQLRGSGVTLALDDFGTAPGNNGVVGRAEGDTVLLRKERAMTENGGRDPRYKTWTWTREKDQWRAGRLKGAEKAAKCLEFEQD